MCRQLDNQFGYAHSHSIPLHNAAFGSGVGPIFIDNLACDANKVMINDCTVHGTIGLTECDHSSDTGVTCVGGLMNTFVNTYLSVCVSFVSTDVDECSSEEHNTCDNEGAICTNTIGSFQCECRDGYTGDGYNCTGLLVITYVVFLPLTM